jgi:predicted AAA+ superfamily ATPase
MLIQDTFLQVIASQKENLTQQKIGLDRDALQKLPHLTAHVLIVSGIRRCGKSTLLFQLLRDKYKDALYLNFEDPRLYDFELNDFRRLDEAIKLLGVKVLLFDEVQIIPEWEKYVRQKLDEDYKIVVTGSNASLLSRELGTKLTGRHITKELFPFSFQEFNKFFNNDANEASVLNYLKMGGFPEYVKNGTDEILYHLFEDILIRDIAVRYGVRDVKNLQRLALCLTLRLQVL